MLVAWRPILKRYTSDPGVYPRCTSCTPPYLLFALDVGENGRTCRTDGPTCAALAERNSARAVMRAYLCACTRACTCEIQGATCPVLHNTNGQRPESRLPSRERSSRARDRSAHVRTSDITNASLPSLDKYFFFFFVMNLILSVVCRISVNHDCL